jgi:hypothetical protein
MVKLKQPSALSVQHSTPALVFEMLHTMVRKATMFFLQEISHFPWVQDLEDE